MSVITTAVGSSLLVSGGPSFFYFTGSMIDMSDLLPQLSSFESLEDNEEALKFIVQQVESRVKTDSVGDMYSDAKKYFKNPKVDLTMPLATFESGLMTLNDCRLVYINDLDWKKYAETKTIVDFKYRSLFKSESVTASLKKVDGVEHITAKIPAKGYILSLTTCSLAVSEDAVMLPSDESTETKVLFNGKDITSGAYLSNFVLNDPAVKGAQLIGDGVDKAKEGLSLILPAVAVSGYSSIQVTANGAGNGAYFALDVAAGTGSSSIDKSFECQLTVTAESSTTPVVTPVTVAASGSVATGFTLNVPFPGDQSTLNAKVELNCPTLAFKREVNSHASASVVFGYTPNLTQSSITHASITMRNSAFSAGAAAAGVALVASAMALFF